MEVVAVGPFLDYWEKVRGRTRRVVHFIPAERLEWTWQEGKFTLGDLVRHLAGIERYMYAENAGGGPRRTPATAASSRTGSKRCARTSSAAMRRASRSSGR